MAAAAARVPAEESGQPHAPAEEPRSDSKSRDLWQRQARPMVYERGAGLVGLSNLGNTCFLNSVLQALGAIPAWQRYFCEVTFNSLPALQPGRSHMASALSSLLLQQWGGNSHVAAVQPRGVLRHLAKSNPLFGGFQQQDAHEALRFLLNITHDLLAVQVPQPYLALVTSPPVRFGDPAQEGGGSTPPAHPYMDRSWLREGPYVPPPHTEASVVSDLFEGILASRVTCAACQRESVTFETCFDLSLPIATSRHRKTQQGAAPAQAASVAGSASVCAVHGGGAGGVLAARGVSAHPPHHPGGLGPPPSSSASKQADSGRSVGVESLQVTPMSPSAATAAGSSTSRGEWGEGAVQNTHSEHVSLCVSLADLPTSPQALPSGVTAEGALPAVRVEVRNARAAPVHLHAPPGALRRAEPISTAQLMGAFGSRGSPAPPARAASTATESATSAAEPSPTPSGRVAPVIGAGDQPGGLTGELSDGSDSGDEAVPLTCWERVFCGGGGGGSGGGWGGWGTPVSVMDCLHHYFEAETLSGSNAYACGHCARKTPALRRGAVASPPQVLVLHLKRFSHSGTWGQKLSTRVTFPLTGLDMTPFIWPDAVHAASAALGEAQASAPPAVAGTGPTLPPNPAPFASPHPCVPRATESPFSDSIAHRLVGQAHVSAAVGAAHSTALAGERLGGAAPPTTLPTPPPHTHRAVYNLASVVRHIGGYGGGHYIAFGRNDQDGGEALLTTPPPGTPPHAPAGTWYRYDDSSVSHVSADTVAGTEAYILVYVLTRPAADFVPAAAAALQPARGAASLPRPLASIPDVRSLISAPLVLAGAATPPGSVAVSVPLPFARHYRVVAGGGAGGFEPPPGWVHVSRWWWLKLQCTAHPGPVTSADIATDHGCLKPEVVAAWGDQIPHGVVRLPLAVYEWLVRHYGAAGPPLWSLAPCAESLREARALAERRAAEQERVAAADTRSVGADGGVGEGAEDPAWYIISAAWLRQWRRFIGNKGPYDGSGRGALPPGPVDNTALLRPDGSPAPNLRPHTHFRGLNSKVWGMFIAMYGGGPTIRRATIDMYDATPLPPPPRDILALAPRDISHMGFPRGTSWFIPPPPERRAKGGAGSRRPRP